MCGLTSSFCSKREIFKSLKTEKTQRKTEKSSSPVKSTYQLHQALQERNQLFQLVVVSVHEPALDGDPVGKLKKPTTRFGVVLTLREPSACVSYLIGEGLRWVVDDDGLGEISAQDVQVFDVIPLDADAVLAEQPVPGGHREENHQGLKRDIPLSGLVSPTWPTAFWDPGCSATCQHRLS